MNGEIEWREGLSLSDLIKQIYRALSLSLSLSLMFIHQEDDGKEGKEGRLMNRHTLHSHTAAAATREHTRKEERKSPTFPSLAASFTNFVTFPFSLLSLSLPRPTVIIAMPHPLTCVALPRVGSEYRHNLS